ncbi:MAG: V-type ATP synthase subunit D [Chromatiales bacterium]|jgi:V/A-type H+-transporting ATPase subunit D|nr:V-type ATP synthase subunit D [Chromatiales bacterium]MDH4031545.1 V-type ATP synthase subunit D [Chromatiales bacterium]
MIHPTRTDLLQLKEKAGSVGNSVVILKARRQALIREFLDSVGSFVRSRNAIRRNYSNALNELHLTEGHEGTEFVAAIAATSERDVGADIQEINVMGVRYRELTVYGPFVRSPEERDHGYTASTPHLDESLHLFETVVEAMMENATFESRVKRLGEETLHVTRRTRVLEERVLPNLRSQIRAITQYIGEREREAHFRLKKFKDTRSPTRPRIRQA